MHTLTHARVATDAGRDMLTHACKQVRSRVSVSARERTRTYASIVRALALACGIHTCARHAHSAAFFAGQNFA
eukprot:11963720-Alexandrium_andersonii.AAC.1